MKKLKKIIPLGKYVLVKVVADEARENENGLIIPSNVEQEQKSEGTVEAIGDDVKGLKVGDEVLYGTYAGELIERQENGEKIQYRMLLQNPENPDIIAKLK